MTVLSSVSSVFLVAVPAAVVGAASFGLGSALQQRATLRVRTVPPLDARLVLHLVRQRLWVLGVLAVVGGLALQLVALAFGPLALVQPVVATSILFAAAFAAWLGHRRPDRIVMAGCLLCVAGLAAFLLLARPRAGTPVMDRAPAPWALAASLGAVVMVSLVLAVRVTGTSRVLALSLATGVLFGVNAGLMKVAAGQFRHGGAAELLGHWVFYAAAIIGPTGFLLAQNAFQQGDALAPAVAVIRSVDPIVGVIIAVLWLGERVAASPGVLAGEVAAAAVLVGGITLLAHRSTRLHELECARAGIRTDQGRRCV